jgi:hypothetical protein
MKKIFFVLFLVCNQLAAQSIAQLEDQIKKTAFNIVNAETYSERVTADSSFTRGLVRALKTPYSFNHKFDSLITVSTLFSPDSTFKIFTWQLLAEDEKSYRQKGAIQMNTKDGSLQLIPLFDCSEFTDAPTDSVRDVKHWIGAIYYKIIPKKFNNKTYYTLLGLDGNNAVTHKKWMDVMYFDNDNKPVFGGNFFVYKNDEFKPKQPTSRFVIEYKKESIVKMNYDIDLDLIIFATLISEENDPTKKETLVPYGTYEGFKWDKGKWIHYPRIKELDPDPRVNPDQTIKKKN